MSHNDQYYTYHDDVSLSNTFYSQRILRVYSKFTQLGVHPGPARPPLSFFWCLLIMLLIRKTPKDSRLSFQTEWFVTYHLLSIASSLPRLVVIILSKYFLFRSQWHSYIQSCPLIKYYTRQNYTFLLEIINHLSHL